jgi:hypothetical protein
VSDRSERGPAERARDAAFREFVRPGALPEGARVEEAEARLGAMLEQELGVPLEEEPARTRAEPESAAAAVELRRGAPRPRHARTVWALAATVAVLAGVSWVALTTRPREDGRILRGTPDAPSGVAGAWDARPEIQASATSGARLSWRGAPGADSYAIVFLSADLTERARVDGLVDSAFVLTPATRPAAFAAGEPGLWRVHAYAGGDELGRSAATPLTFP